MLTYLTDLFAALCCLMAAAMLLYGRLVGRSLTALQLIASKRTVPVLPASYHQILDLLTTVVSSSPDEIRAVTV